MDDYLGPGGLDDEGGKANARRKARPMKHLDRSSPRSHLPILPTCLIPLSIPMAPRCRLATTGTASDLLGIRRALKDLLMFRRNFGTCTQRNNEKKKLKDGRRRLLGLKPQEEKNLRRKPQLCPFSLVTKSHTVLSMSLTWNACTICILTNLSKPPTSYMRLLPRS